MENAVLSHFFPSEVGIYGYEKKGVEIPYALVLGSRGRRRYSPSYGGNKKDGCKKEFEQKSPVFSGNRFFLSPPQFSRRPPITFTESVSEHPLIVFQIW
jgi:hypothetical protein